MSGALEQPKADSPEASAAVTLEATLVELDAPKSSLATVGVAASLVAHLMLVGALVVTAKTIKPHVHVPITVKIHKVEKPKPVVVEEKKKEEPPPPPKPVEKPKPKEKKIVSERKPKEKPVPKAPPVQGLAPSATVPGGKGIAAPVGNTLMTEDTGKRLKPEEVQPMDQDLSADAALVAGSVTIPKYTDDAIDVNLQGSAIVDVYVDAHGGVQQAELRKKVGYGMDERLIQAALQARFTPRKDKQGRPEPGWSEIKFRLEIPG